LAVRTEGKKFVPLKALISWRSRLGKGKKGPDPAFWLWEVSIARPNRKGGKPAPLTEGKGLFPRKRDSKI